MTWFNPDAIRSDIEGTFASRYYPAVYSASQSYLAGQFARLGGFVYRANQAVTGIAPPSAEWDLIGDTCKVIYENVPSSLDSECSVRMQINWGGSSNESVYCPQGRLRRYEGVIALWIFTPKNQGTSKGNRVAASIRQTLELWNRMGTCGEQVMIHSVNGPRSTDSFASENHYLQIVSASVSGLERLSQIS